MSILRERELKAFSLGSISNAELAIELEQSLSRDEKYIKKIFNGALPELNDIELDSTELSSISKELKLAYIMKLRRQKYEEIKVDRLVHKGRVKAANCIDFPDLSI